VLNVVYYVACGLDGYIATPEGRVDWLNPFQGGGELASAFRADGLISRYMIAVIPVVLGAEIPLLADGGQLEPLELVEVQPYPNGVVQLIYEPGTR